MFPNWLVSASDLSQDALDVARENIKKYNLAIRTFQGDSLEPFIKENMNLDILVSNPPYIQDRSKTQDSVKNFEPASALWLDKNNSVYEKIFRDAYKVKRGELLMCFEIDDGLEDYLMDLMARYLRDYEFVFEKDLNGMTRFLFVNLK